MPIGIYGENNPDLRRFTPDREATIWRYMDLGKYLDLITRKELWFTRAIEFRKADPYEGALTVYDQKMLEQIVGAKTKNELKDLFQLYGRTSLITMMEMLPNNSLAFFQAIVITGAQHSQFNPYSSLVSCWHENKGESDAMWDLYAKKNAGIAIKTTISKTVTAFRNSAHNIAVAKVAYDIDGTMSALTSGIYDSLLIKRQAFAHENEIRLLVFSLVGYEAPGYSEDNQVYNLNVLKSVPTGLYIPCDIEQLIDEIVVSPLIPSYAYEGVAAITKQYMPSTIVRKSRLLTMESFSLGTSADLELILNTYIKTRRLLDVDAIRAESAEPERAGSSTSKPA
jgi:hypothetical protein